MALCCTLLALESQRIQAKGRSRLPRMSKWRKSPSLSFVVLAIRILGIAGGCLAASHGLLWLQGRGACEALLGRYRSLESAHVAVVTICSDDLAGLKMNRTDAEDCRIWARVIRRLSEHGARLIVLEPYLEPRPSADRSELIRAIRRSGRVVLSQLRTRDTGQGVSEGFQTDPLLAEAALATGYVDAGIDLETVGETVLLSTVHQRVRANHLALEAAARCLDAAVDVSQNAIVLRPRSPSIPTRTVPLLRSKAMGRFGETLFSFSRNPILPRVSITELLDPAADHGLLSRLFKERVVVVGKTKFFSEKDAPISPDPHRLPYARFALTPSDGVLSAVFAENILSGVTLEDLGVRLGSLPLIALALLGAVMMLSSPARAAWISGLFLVSVAIGTVVLYRHGLLLDGATLSLGVVLVSIADSFARLVETARHQDRLEASLLAAIASVRRRLPNAHEGALTPAQLVEFHSRSFLGRFLPERLKELEPLGEGGMGVVFRALDSARGEIVAVKVLSPLLRDDPEVRHRFVAEARTLKKLSHSGIVRIFDVANDLLPHFTMEYVEGRSLMEMIRVEGALPVDFSVRLIWKVATVLQYIHEKGVIHRDLKPSNIIVSGSDEVKLLDFGLAQDVDVTGITRTGTLLGTPRYMAPEQMRGRRPSPATDVYSLAIVFLELLTGRPPERCLWTHKVPRVELQALGVSADLMAVIEESTQEDMLARLPNGRTLAERLSLLCQESCP